MRAGEWKLSGECSLHLGFRFVYSSGPRSSPALWVLAGDYILGSGQRDGGAGPLQSQASLPVGPQHRHTPREKPYKHKKRRRFPKSRFFREEVLDYLRVREIKVQLAEKNKIKIRVLYGRLIQTETGGASNRLNAPAWRWRGRGQRQDRRFR